MAAKTASEMRDLFQAALEAFATGKGIQSYTIAGTTFSRANLAQLQSQFEFWDMRAAEEEFGNASVINLRRPEVDL